MHIFGTLFDTRDCVVGLERHSGEEPMKSTALAAPRGTISRCDLSHPPVAMRLPSRTRFDSNDHAPCVDAPSGNVVRNNTRVFRILGIKINLG